MNRTETAVFMNMCMIYDNNRNVLVQDRTDRIGTVLHFREGTLKKANLLLPP